ncbi:MAG: hypothetical protein P4L53_03860 [Candidatus Obscuribacterales bacterium]|nr:hypothetical protein [Candidatus Obscuribacterales bacterium]
MTIKKIMLLLTLVLSLTSAFWVSASGYYDTWCVLSLASLLATVSFWEQRTTVERFRFLDNNFLVLAGGLALAFITTLAVIQRITDPYHVYARDNLFLVAVLAIGGLVVGVCVSNDAKSLV